jgi:hypothetical protein
MRQSNDNPRWLVSQGARSRKARCHALPPPSEAELDRMIEEFHRRGGAVTELPPAYALPTTAARSAGSHAVSS